MIYLILFLFFAYIAYYYWNVSKYPKGPFPFPIVGNAFQISPNILQEDLEKWRETHGNVFTIWLVNRPIVVLMRYDEIKEAIVTKGDAIINRTGDFPETLFKTTENGGVIFSSGENWREQRRTALHILRDFGVGKNVMEQQIQEQLERFVERVRTSDEKRHLEFRWSVQVLVANIINQLLYGFSYPHNDCQRLMDYVTKLNSVFSEMWESPLMFVAQAIPITRQFPYIKDQIVGKHVDKFNWCIELVKEDVKNALQNYSKEDEPSCFVQAYYQRMDTNPALNMEQLYNVCSDFFMAGMETTSTTIRWAVLYLAKYQDVQEKLRREVAKVVGFERYPSLHDKTNMTYTTAFIAEIQRVANILPINLLRKTSENLVIDEKFIPAHTNVVPQVFSANLDEKWFKNPREFQPERFINNDGTLNSELLSHSIPFGLGKRMCAGESLARAELFLGLTTIVQKFKISTQPNQEVDFSPIYGTVLLPKPNHLRVEDVDPVDYM